MIVLVGLSAEAPITVTVTKSPWLIGRSAECDLVVPHPSVSKVHIELSERQGQWVVRNRSRTNPVRLDDAIVIGERPIGSGALLGMGPVVFRFEQHQADAADAAELPRTVGYSDAAAKLSTQRPDHAGRITGQDGVLNLIAMFQTSRATGRLALLEAGGGELSLYYESGEVIGARSGSMIGRHAVMLLALKTYADYRMYEGESWDGERLRSGTQGMLLEVTRMIDNSRR